MSVLFEEANELVKHTLDRFALFVGPTKSGTTWIHAYLTSRGDIALPDSMKETFFFDKVYDNGFDWYAGLFAQRSEQLKVEVAPSLFYKDEACERALKHLPGAKVICMVRNPLDRAVSHYFHYRARGMPQSSLAAANAQYNDIVEAGLYAKHLPKWQSAFGSHQVYVLSYEKLKTNPIEFCRDLCTALEIEYIAPNQDLHSNKANAARVPRSLLAAKAFQSLRHTVRRHGGHKITSALKRLPIEKLLFSSGDKLGSERDTIRSQAATFSNELIEDWETFQTQPVFPSDMKTSSV